MAGRTVVTGGAPAGIVADDLTGATDSAVQFAQQGWAARLALTMPSADTAEEGSAVAFVTDARALPPEAARTGTTEAVRGLRESGASRLFVKIDSTMRGTVIDQVHGAIDAWSAEHPDAVAIVCSAYPAMGRTIEGGHILVNGEGVHTTAVGTDPVSPVSTSDLTELLPGSVPVRLCDGTAAENAGVLKAALASGSRIAVVDAQTDADLARLAETIDVLGPRAIPVGAAGLAVAMSRVWTSSVVAPAEAKPHARRVAVVVSSLHDVSRTQAEQLKREFPSDQLLTLAPSLEQALAPASIAEWVADQLQGADALPPVVVIESPSARPSSAPEGKASAAELVAESLATITDLVVDRGVDALMLLGGEGARAVLGRLGSEALLVHSAIREGIPIGTIEGGKADGLTVVTKAGGFGTPASVAEIVAELLSATKGHRS